MFAASSGRVAAASIATGVRPDKHGLYAFSKLASDYTHALNTSQDSRHPAMWDALRSVVVNVPMTYPASEIEGLMITGMMTPADSPRFTHPPEFRDRLKRDYPDYQTGLDWSDYYGRKSALAADLADVLAVRRRLMNDLLAESDHELFFIVYTEPDRLQHLVWDLEVMLEHYKLLDEMLGDAIDHVERDGGTLYVVSDHGFGPVKRQANLNRGPSSTRSRRRSPATTDSSTSTTSGRSRSPTGWGTSTSTGPIGSTRASSAPTSTTV